NVAAERNTYTGVGSCSAFACHGGNAPDGDHRSAYVTWMARDPHSRALASLSGELSAKIEARLAARSGREPLNARGAARGGRGRTAPAAHGSPALREDGVDCETCHGPASRWIEPHTLPSWKHQSAQEKAAKGMMPTKDLAARAALCAGCHV